MNRMLVALGALVCSMACGDDRVPIDGGPRRDAGAIRDAGPPRDAAGDAGPVPGSDAARPDGGGGMCVPLGEPCPADPMDCCNDRCIAIDESAVCI